MSKCTVVLLLGFFFVISGCKRDGSSDITLPNTEIVLTDVSYGEDPLQKMDVYLPANRAHKTKIIVYLHGGSWTTGDKSEAKETALYFQRKGFAFISMNYRLTRTAANNINPAQMHDISMALDYITRRHIEWIITGNRICLFGGSAGAHLSLLYAYSYNADKKVKAVISVAGPVDLADPNIQNTAFKALIESFIGCKLGDNKQAWLDASPSHFISGACVPTIFFHGNRDAIVPYRQSVNAYNRLLELGVNTKLTSYQGVGHDFLGVDTNKMLQDMEEFINSAYP